MTAPGDVTSDEVAQLRLDLRTANDQVAGLVAAVESNRRIGIAVGMLMARDELSADGAFEVLARLSQERNEKLRVLAGRIVDTGALPGRRPGG